MLHSSTIISYFNIQEGSRSILDCLVSYWQCRPSR